MHGMQDQVDSARSRRSRGVSGTHSGAPEQRSALVLLYQGANAYGPGVPDNSILQLRWLLGYAYYQQL